MDQVAKTVSGLTCREVMTLDGHAEDVFEGAGECWASCRGGDSEEDAGLTEGFDLAGEDLDEAKVAPAGGEDGGVGGERDGAEGGTVVRGADDKLEGCWA